MAHLIDKDVLVAEIKRRMDENSGKQSLPQYFGMVEEDLNILSFIDTLEVKDVEKEYKDFIKKSDNGRSMLETAKYFFELGLKIKQS